jgi:iron complex outermembrane receptor protein
LYGEIFLKLNHKITCAVVAALGAHSGATYAAEADTSSAAAATGVEEVVVTAQRRVQSIQDVPITIQALTGAQLAELNVSTIRGRAQVPAERHVPDERPRFRATSSCAD